MDKVLINRHILARTLWGHLRHADWRTALTRYGGLGIIVEALRALTGFASWPFILPLDEGWPPAAIKSLLLEHGIPSWGWGFAGGEYYFNVKLRQAHWAQYLLLSYGVPVGGRLLDGSAARPSRSRIRQPAPAAPKAHSLDRLDNVAMSAVTRAVDRIANW